MKFERKPIQVTPTCAMCARPVKEHTPEQMKLCADERRKSQKEKNVHDKSSV